MATPQEAAAKLVEGTFEVLRGDNAFKAQVAAQIVDLLVGTDPQALVRSVPGLPESMVEMLSDAVVKILEEAVLRKLTASVAP